MNILLKSYYDQYESYYKSSSQLIRVVSEYWFKDNMYCPFCSFDNLEAFNNNYPVADFYCKNCGEEFQLKAKKNKLGNTITDGEYNKMIDAIHTNKTPNLFLLNYSPEIDYILDLIIIPKEFILPNAIQKRHPLSEHARRAGWTGCNILLDKISDNGKIYAVKDKRVLIKEEVVNNIISLDYIRNLDNIESRGWINDILLIISNLNKNIFNLGEIYSHAEYLRKLHPKNNNIEAKIRQQLQILRDNGVVEFLGNGLYKKITN